MYIIIWVLIAPLIFLFLPTRVIGKQFIKKTKNKSAIYCSNHQTIWDPFLFKVRICPFVNIMAKKSLFNNKFSAWFCRTCHAYPVDRGGNDIEAVKKTLGYLKHDKQILIFPEGTRIKNADTVNIKTGVVSFALKTDSYIIPSYFRKITKPFVFNTLLMGEPFKFSDMEEFKGKKADKELINKANEILTQKIEYLKNVDIKEYKKIVKSKLKKTDK